MPGIEEMWMNVLGKIEHPPTSILDVGCRDLRSSSDIAFQFRTGYYGCDVNEEAIKEAENIAVLSGSTVSIVPEDDFGMIFHRTFDVIIASCVLYHLRDDLAAKFFEALPKMMHPFSEAYATVNTTDKESHWMGFQFVRRPVSFYKDMATKNLLSLEDLGKISKHGYDLKTTTANNRLLRMRRV